MAVTLNPTAALVIFTMLMCGTINTVDMKAQFDTYAMGDDESMGVHAFRKPWFTVFGMFLSMSMGLVVHFGQQLFYRAKASRSEGNLNHENIENLKECLRESSATETAVKKLGVWGTIWRCSVPALGDLSSSALGSIGLLFINASTYQMLRGASILSTAALSSIVLKKKFTRDQYIALVIVTISLCMIAWVGSDQTSNAGAGNEQGGEDGQKGDNTAIIGVALVLVGQIFVAGQFVWEERVMKVIKVPPMLLLGIEGVFGSLFTYFVIFPAVAQVPGNDAFGTFEDFHDSITMLNNSSRLRLLFGGYLLSIVFFNLSSVYCTKVPTIYIFSTCFSELERF